MLKLRFAPFTAIALSAAIVFAQEAAPSTDSKPDAPASQAIPKVETTEAAPVVPDTEKRPPVRKRRVIAKATPVPVATPVPKKPGFWQRLFGKKNPTPPPATPTPTPKAVVKKKTVVKPRTENPRVAETGTGAAAKEPEKSDTAKVEPKKPTEPSAEKMPPAKTGKPRKAAERAQNFPPSSDNADAEVVEKQKYDQAKSKAVADPKLQELRGKADLAPSEEESRKALRVYNKAMFKRMKEIDPSISDHVDRMEAAVMKRLGE